MNPKDLKSQPEWVGEVTRQLDRSVNDIDDLTAKRLERARKHALSTTKLEKNYWRPAVAATVLIVAMVPVAWKLMPQQPDTKFESELLGMSMSAEDLDDLDMLMGLEDVQS